MKTIQLTPDEVRLIQDALDALQEQYVTSGGQHERPHLIAEVAALAKKLRE